jgi:hypothetical protein
VSSSGRQGQPRRVDQDTARAGYEAQTQELGDRRPMATGLDRDGLRALLDAARADGLRSAALITLLALNCLRIDEALSRDVEDLDASSEDTGCCVSCARAPSVRPPSYRRRPCERWSRPTDDTALRPCTQPNGSAGGMRLGDVRRDGLPRR